MKPYKFLSLSILSAFIIATTSCNGGKKAEAKIEKEEEVLPEDIVELRADQIKLAEIELGKIGMHSLSGTLKVNGLVTVAPQNLATVSMPMGGFVKSTSLVPGSSVHKGQVLALLENPKFVDLQQNYLEVKSKFEYAEAEYKRHNDLYKEDVYSQKNVQLVTSEYKTLKVQLTALRQKLELIGINAGKLTVNNIRRSVAVTSPISGYVKAVNVSIGKSVAPSDVLFEIVNSDQLLLELSLFEKDVDKVAIGQRIRFFINNENEQHNAVIYQTGNLVNADKTYKVYARVKDKCRNVLPGMYANAIIEGTVNNVSALPSDAIVSFDDKDYIFVFEKNKSEDGKPFTEYRMVQVRKGVADGGLTEVILPDGFDQTKAKVVIKGTYNLLSAKKNAGEMACD
jgi:RND family efflux transporter, MFP subunit